MQTADSTKKIKDAVDEKFMYRCIEIAKNGLGTTAPNPMVGAIVVYKNNIIGEGYTSPFGGSHAEVNAVASVKDHGVLSKSTLYVTLEPCSHFGKTPPCSDLIIKHKIPRVVIGLKDPHEKVAGKGIQKLLDTGCSVRVGILEQECREHHKRFLTFYEKKRPYVILKWAETADGFIAPKKELRDKDPQPYWITGALSRQLAHKWRGEEQAILVGTATALEDNPKLDVRLWSGTSPVRVVFDWDLKIPSDYHLLDKTQRTIVFTREADSTKHLTGIEYVVRSDTESSTNLICSELYRFNIQSIIVEGGAQTLQSFIDANLWDEARIFKGASQFKEGIQKPEIKGRIVAFKTIEKDQLTILNND